MDLPAIEARYVHNPLADRDRAYSDTERGIVSREGFEGALKEISSWPGYAPTPLVALGGLATALGLADVRYKDEDKRFELKSFKALGGAFAVLRILQKHLAAHGHTNVTSADLVSGAHRGLTKEVTVTSATDGNHGRSVAWGAQMFGCECIIYLHAHVSETREMEISKYGARIIRVPGNYDDSVRQCAEDAQACGRMLVADTSSGGGDASVPALVMQGYTVMAQEFLTQCEGRPLTHVFVQGGVGGIAAAIAGHLWETMGPQRPRVVVVEPTRADCIYRSIEAGKPTPVPGDFETFMACLAAGEVSPLAWPILKYAADDVLTLPDTAAEETMRLLAAGVAGDPPIVSGESGCAATAGLIAAASNRELCRQLDLGPNSHVVVIGSEGATDEAIYRQVVGRSSDQVARRAA